jgi:hypothetical protein
MSLPDTEVEMAEQDLPLDEYHRAGLEITNGNPEVYKSLYSRRDDATLANPFGPPVRGWKNVSATLDRAAENYLGGEVVGFEEYAGARSCQSDNLRTTVVRDLALRGLPSAEAQLTLFSELSLDD